MFKHILILVFLSAGISRPASLAAQDAPPDLPGIPAQLQSKDYDALFAQLQKYRDDLQTMGLEKAEMEKQLAQVNERLEELERKMNSMGKFAADGFKIFGRQSGTFDDLLLVGPGAPRTGRDTNGKEDTPRRYRTISMATDFTFTATRGPVSGMAELRYKSYFSSSNYLGVGWMAVEIRTPVVVQMGDFHAQWSPLTMWRNDDEDPFEVEPFGGRHRRLLDDLEFKDRAVRLRGLRLLSDLLLFNTATLHLEGLVQPLGYNGSPIYYTGMFPMDGTFPIPNKGMLANGIYNTYLAGWRARTSLSALNLAYMGTAIFDTPDSNAPDTASIYYNALNKPDPSMPNGTVKMAGYHSEVHSVQASVTMFAGTLGLSAEMAQSLYSNPNDPALYFSTVAGQSGYLTGTAMLFQAESKSTWYSLKGFFRQADRTFISAPAQGRSHDTSTSMYGPFIHESDRYNPATGMYFDNFSPSMPQSWEDGYTKIFLPPQAMNVKTSGNFVFNYLMPYNAAINADSPYGFATPNRTGYGVEGSLNLWKGGLQPLAFANLSNQLYPSLVGSTQSAEAYAVIGAGGRLDLQPMLGWPLSFSGGWKSQKVANGNAVDFNSAQLNAGAEWKPGKDVVFYAGAKQLGYAGTMAYPITYPGNYPGGPGVPAVGIGAYMDPITGALKDATLPAGNLAGFFNYDQSWFIWALGMQYALSAETDIELNYGQQVFSSARAVTLADNAKLPMQYGLEQGFLKFNLRF